MTAILAARQLGKLILRDYQQRAVDDVRAQFRAGRRAPVLVMPTGAGKTQVAAYVIRSALERGNRVVFGAGRTELLDQTVDKLHNAGVTDVRVIQASRDSGNRSAEVVVASVQTLTTPRWITRLPPAELVILDECHHGSAATWARLLNAYPNALRLGLTATPERADGKPLGDLFDCLVTGPSVRELTELGHLVPCVVFPPAGGAKLDTAEIALDPVAAYQRHGNGERAIVFCISREHSRRVSEEFNAAGIMSAAIDGTMSRSLRKDTLHQFRAGRIRVLTSVGVLTEGWDDPGCSVAILVRGYGHPGLFIQCAGRILRPAPGKTTARLIDLVGSVWEHGTPDIDREYSLDGKAISGAVRDQIKQCRTCGAVFRTAARCPMCAAEQPVMPFSPPTNTNIGLVQVSGPIAPPPKPEHIVRINARYAGRCAECRQHISPGDSILWATVAKRAIHSLCPAQRSAAPVEP